MGISLDEKNKKVYVSNPEGDSETEIDLSNFSKQNISSGSSPLGIFFLNLTKVFMLVIGMIISYQSSTIILKRTFKLLRSEIPLQEFSYRNLVKIYLLQIEKTTIYMSLMLKNLN